VSPSTDVLRNTVCVCRGMNDSDKPYLCHSMERVSLDGVSKKVLFYVHDADGNEKLAVTVADYLV